ncbi:MAG TPA: UbiA-like protein EboC [Cyclobacteriaceae bacterium]|nr:UbiA-like protein EboC [Cyclobacteriaceae bacterium]
MKKLMAYLRLTRPANVVTAIADILAGIAVSGAALVLFSPETVSDRSVEFSSWLWLCLSTIGLYGGGVAFNDVFDAELDRVERPERPIPSGIVPLINAAVMASLLLLMGVVAAWQVSLLSGMIAIVVAFLCVLYDAWGKHQLIFGPINMGLCRTGNLLLGISIIPGMVAMNWYLGLIPLVYIAAITMISRGEVHGGNKSALQGGLAMYALIVLVLVALSFTTPVPFWQVLPFLVLLCYMIFPPLLQALKTPKPQLIGKSVKAGVISQIVVNSALSAMFAGWQFGVLVVLLLPLSLWIARKFAVT